MDRVDTTEAAQTNHDAEPSGIPKPDNIPHQEKKPTPSPAEKQKIAAEKQRLANEERKKALHPQTGTESEQLWPTSVKKQHALPLLDLDLAWTQLANSTPISPSQTEPQPTDHSIDHQNASLIAQELKAYIIATCSNEQPKRRQNPQQSQPPGEDDHDGQKAEWLAPIPDMAHPIGSEEEEHDDDDSLKSTYGSSILIKLQWECRSPQKDVPEMDYDSLAHFISRIFRSVNDAFDNNSTAAQLVLDLIALEMAPLLIARYIAALETEHAALAHSSFTLLKLCATNANPKEMHIAIKTFLSKVDRIYTEATSYLILYPLIDLWAEVIPRVHNKRKPLLADMVQHVDRMLASAETFEASFVPDDGIGIERPGRLLKVPDILLDFYEKLISAQEKQMENAADMSLDFDFLGRPIPFLRDVGPDGDVTVDDGQKSDEKVAGDVGEEGLEIEDAKSAGKQEESAQTAERNESEVRSGFERKAAAAAAKENSFEWARERAVTLAKVLNLFGMLWMRLPAPAGQVRNVTKRGVKRKTSDKKDLKALKMKEESVERCLKLISRLGWSSLALVCQLATDGMSLVHTTRAGERMKEHIGYEVLSKKDLKNATYSLNAVGFYISGALRRVETTVDEHGNTHFGAETSDLAGTAFDLLDPTYAFDLVLPFLLPTVGHSNVAASVRGITALGAFLSRLPDNAFVTLGDILRLRIGTGSGGRDVNVLGLLQGLSRALPALDNPSHRIIAYEAIQTLLRKCASPVGRFVLTECLYFTASSSVISAQFMTELKDAVMYSDSMASPSRKEDWSWMQASALRWRFAQDCFPRNFLPRKELLSFRDQLSTAASLIYFLVARDKRLLADLGESDEELRDDVLRRQRFCKAYGELGKECIRALASVAEHDRKNIPSSALAKKSMKDAVAIYQVSGLTLNQCVGAISFLESALRLL